MLLWGCRQESGGLAQPAAERALRIAAPAGPYALEPNCVNEEFALGVLSNVYETLVDLDAGLGLRPGLAQSWHSPDDLTWVFRLRPGVRLHDGSPLLPRHVVASLEHARLDPASRRRAQLSAIRAVEVGDADSVIVHTTSRFDPLPTRLSNVFVWAPGPPGAAKLGTGPYRVSAWTPGGDTQISLVAGHPAIDHAPPQVTFLAIPSAADRVRRLERHEVDLVIDAPAESLASLARRSDLRPASVRGLRVLFLGMDAARPQNPEFGAGRNPFHDVRVRRAVAHAVDRDALVRGPLGGQAEVVDQIASPQELGGDVPVPRVRHDPALARRLLDEAGYHDGFAVPLDYMAKYRAMDAVVPALVADLAAVGIRVTPRLGSPASVMERLERRDTAFYLMGWISDAGDARLSYEYLLHTPGPGYGLDNGGGYSAAEVDELIEAASRLRGRVELRTLWTRLALRVQADMPVAPLYRQSDLYGFDAALQFEPRLDRRLRAAEVRWTTVARAR